MGPLHRSIASPENRSRAAAQQENKQQDWQRYPEQPKQNVPSRAGLFDLIF
jgi:hypothetical protein